MKGESKNSHSHFHSFQFKIQSFIHSEFYKVFLFSLLNFLLGVGYICGFFSANALLVSRVGAAPLFYVYLGGSLLALIAAAAFSFLVSRYSHRQAFSYSFLFLGILIFVFWIVLRFYSPAISIYFLLRIFLYAVFILTSLAYWLVASDSFTNFEAKRRFPYLIAAGILGEMAGGAFIGFFATYFHAVNFILVWGIILFFSPLLLIQIRSSGLIKFKKQSISKHFIPFRHFPPLVILLFIFWAFYSFFAFGIDYHFNLKVVETFPQEDLMTSFFGKIATLSGLAILIYQLFFASWITEKQGVDRTIFILPILLIFTTGFVYFQPSLLSISIAQGTIFYLIDSVAVGLLHPVLNVFNEKQRGFVRVFSEGFGRPVGTFILLGIVLVLFSFLKIQEIYFVLFGGAILFLVYPFLFHRAYLKHLIHCLKSHDPLLVSNAIQALGERNKKQAVAPLLSLLHHTDTLPLKKTIILSLGKIQSREAFREIVDLFSIRNESLQLAVIESLSQYKNYESMFALFRMMKSKENVSFQVRMNAIFFLTKLIGKNMISFLMEALEDEDPRTQANAIESIGILKDKKTIPILQPFLNHSNHRIRANTAIALYPFRSSRKESKQTIHKLYSSENLLERSAALYAIGILKLKEYEKDLVLLLDSPEKKLVQHAATALARMKNPIFTQAFLRLILDEDEKFALETIFHLRKFPRESRFYLFEAISKLNPQEQNEIYSRLDQSSIDFSIEKSMIETQLLPASARF